MTADGALAEIDAAMLRFANTGDAARLVDEIADALTQCRSGPVLMPNALDAARDAHHEARNQVNASARALADRVIAGDSIEYATEMYRKHRGEEIRLRAAWLDASDALRSATGHKPSVRADA